MARGGKRPGAGRRYRSKGRATIERELKAIQELQRNALAPVRTLAKDRLAELVLVVKGNMERFQAAAINSGAPGEPGYKPELWRELREWIRIFASVADASAAYESPKFRAIVVANATGDGAPFVVRIPTVLQDSVAWQAAVGSLPLEPAQAASGSPQKTLPPQQPPIPEPAPAPPAPEPAVLTADQRGRVSTQMPSGAAVIKPSGSQEWLDAIAVERGLRLIR